MPWPTTPVKRACYAEDITAWASGPKFPLLESMINIYLREVGICLKESSLLICCCLPNPMTLANGGVRCSRLWSTSQHLRPSDQQCSHSGGVCPQIQGRQCGAYVGAVEEMMCVVCVDVTEGA